MDNKIEQNVTIKIGDLCHKCNKNKSTIQIGTVKILCGDCFNDIEENRDNKLSSYDKLHKLVLKFTQTQHKNYNDYLDGKNWTNICMCCFKDTSNNKKYCENCEKHKIKYID